MLTLKNITAGYGTKIILKDLNLDMKKSSIHGLAGINGSGKTTLLNVMFGIIKPSAGQILFEGKELLYTNIGYMETVNFFYRKITGREYLGLFKIGNPDYNIDKWNSVFDLPLDSYIDSYSTGMKKKLALMGILSLDRDVLILDEPFNSLDLETNNLLYTIIRLLKENGKTILVTSHIIETLTSICDEIHYIDEGRIGKTFTPDEYNNISEYIFEGRNKEKIILAQSLLSG